MGLCATSAARAVEITFENITGNQATNAADGESQFLLELTDAGPELALLSFTNLGPEDSSIARIFVDAEIVLAVEQIMNGPGVAFEESDSMRSLPAGELVGFSPDFRLTALSPLPFNGVNPGEELDVLLRLDAGSGFSDLLADLAAGEFRVGLHAIAFQDGGSEAFVNRIPEPATIVPILALVAFASCRRRPRGRGRCRPYERRE